MKKNNQWLLMGAVALMSISVLTGCKKDSDDDSTPAPTTFTFLGDGRQLEYSFNSIFLPDTSFTVNLTADGGAFKNVQIFYPSVNKDSTWLKECGTNLAISGTSSSVDCANIFFKGTRAVGDSWSFTTSSGSTATHAVVEKNVSVTVAAGTFICDKMTYRSTTSITTDTLYFNNQYSFIKYEGLLGNYELRSKNF